MNRFAKDQNHTDSFSLQPIETTVTFLEMTKPPSARVLLPSNINAALLHCHRPQLHFYRYLYFQVGHLWKWEIRLRMTDDALRSAIWADTTAIHVLYLDGAPAGFFEINTAEPNAPDIAYFGMINHAAGRGLGRWFLSAAIHAAWANSPQRVTVNTCTLDHPAALPLYQKLGFAPVRQARGRVLPLNKSELAHLGSSGIFPPAS